MGISLIETIDIFKLGTNKDIYLVKYIHSFWFAILTKKNTSPYEPGKLGQVDGATDRDVLLFASVRYTHLLNDQYRKYIYTRNQALRTWF